MSRPRSVNETHLYESPSLGDLLTARPSGLIEPECWAILCQAVQALQDLFLSDGACGDSCIPLVTPSTLILSSKGRVKLCQNNRVWGCNPPAHLAGYLAPEYRPNKQCTDTETEKMWIYALGETLKRVTLTSHAATTRLSSDLCQVLTDMTKLQTSSRASLMYLLDVISEYCKKRHQNRPFSHIVMDLHQEAMAAIELRLDTPWGPPAMPELRPRTRNRCESNSDGIGTIPRRWINLTRNTENRSGSGGSGGISSASNLNTNKLTKEASTSMEDLSFVLQISNAPAGAIVRPKSMCVPDMRYLLHHQTQQHQHQQHSQPLPLQLQKGHKDFHFSSDCAVNRFNDFNDFICTKEASKLQSRPSNLDNNKRLKVRRNPVNRAASRLYRASVTNTTNAKIIDMPQIGQPRDCIGPEFVVRATLPNKLLSITDPKGHNHNRKMVTVIMLNGQKLDVHCNPNTTTAGQLFEAIIQKEYIEENFMLGLSALIAGDFVFLPSDTRICKAMPGNTQNATLTLFMRVRFFLPSLRGIRGLQARHLLYLQLRRSILEHQLPCSFSQLIELDGLALQAEFGDYNDREHGTRDYFLMEHYVPETMSCAIDDLKSLRLELIQSHISKRGMHVEKAEQEFIILAQSLPHYGGHFYTATWILKDNNHKDVWLYISAQGINLYERGRTSNCGPQLYEIFEWRSIQTLCYSKHYLCILPHSITLHGSKLKKYKLKMDHKKTEYTSLQSLSQQFGIPLKDIKNETNSLYKLEALTNPDYMTLDKATVDAQTEFKIEFRLSSRSSNRKRDESINDINCSNNNKCKRSKSVNDFQTLNENIDENYQNKENENPILRKNETGLVLDSSYFSGLPNNVQIPNDKRRGVKMGTKVFSNAIMGIRVSRSMETMNACNNEYLDEMSLQSVSLHCSSTSISRSPTNEECAPTNEAYILDSTIKSCSNIQFLPNFQESLNETLLDKLNNISFAEERLLSTVCVERDQKGSLGLQITEGSDGNVYIQSVILGGPAHLTGNIFSGDQCIAVDNQSLLGMKYKDALNLLKNTGNKVTFVLSRIIPNRKNNIHTQSTLKLTAIDDNNLRFKTNNINETNLKNLKHENSLNKLKRLSYPPNNNNNYYDDSKSPIEKHLTESCHDVSNLHKYQQNNSTEVPYHKHIRYEIEAEKDFMSKKQLPPQETFKENNNLNKNLSKSCTQIFSNNNKEVVDNDNKAVVVDFVPKINGNQFYNFRSLDRLKLKEQHKHTIPPIALPRCLGLSRKWRGPVRYPVTPIKKNLECTDYLSTSDEEQVFI